jgi:hypothetical protein
MDAEVSSETLVAIYQNTSGILEAGSSETLKESTTLHGITSQTIVTLSHIHKNLRSRKTIHDYPSLSSRP